MAGGGPEGGAHFAPLGAKRPCRHVAVWSHGAQTHRIDELQFRWAGVSRSALRSLLRLTAGAFAADSIAARPVQVLVALRPGCVAAGPLIRQRPQCCISLMPVPSGAFPLGHVPEVSAL